MKTKMLSVAFFYFSESGLFNRLRPIQTLFFLLGRALAPPRLAIARPPFSPCLEHSTISDYVKQNPL
jgi:hypothetical protein